MKLIALSAKTIRPEEAIYLLPSSDRVTVVFSTIFKDETDQIFGKVFLQEFVDARRRPSCQTAPQVLYSNRDPPLEIREAKGLIDGGNVGYVTFGRALPSPSASPSPSCLLLGLRGNYHIIRQLMLWRPNSALPSAFLDPYDRRPVHHSDSALPQLPSLPHQMLESVHALAYASSGR